MNTRMSQSLNSNANTILFVGIIGSICNAILLVILAFVFDIKYLSGFLVFSGILTIIGGIILSIIISNLIKGFAIIVNQSERWLIKEDNAGLQNGYTLLGRKENT